MQCSITYMELKQNILLKYQTYFKNYPFIKNVDLKCKILLKEQYTDGRYDYFGDRVETMRHGTYGIMLLINKNKTLSIYEGSWKSDTYNGKGYLYTISHPSSPEKMFRLIQGEWANGLLHGKGVIKYFALNKGKWQAKVCFEGEFKNGQKCGFGVQQNDENIYRGQFNKDFRSGMGRLEDNYGNFFDGTYEKGFLIGEAYETLGDNYIITDKNGHKYIYRKPINSTEFNENFTSILHQIRKQIQ